MKILSISMRVSLLAIALILPSLASAEIINEFTAVSHGQEVYVQWTSGPENGVAQFRIQRSFDGRYFHTLHTLLPTGSNSRYTYIDSDLFKSNLQSFYYRIEVVLATDRTAYSTVEKVEMDFSGIRRTWGSIKAMFR